MGGLQDRTQRENSCQALHDTALGSQGLLVCPHCPTSNVPSLLSLQAGNSAPEHPPLFVWLVALGSQVSTWFQLPEVLIPRWSVSHCAPSLLFRPYFGPHTVLSCHRLFSMRHLSIVKLWTHAVLFIFVSPGQNTWPLAKCLWKRITELIGQHLALFAQRLIPQRSDSVMTICLETQSISSVAKLLPPAHIGPHQIHFSPHLGFLSHPGPLLTLPRLLACSPLAVLPGPLLTQSQTAEWSAHTLTPAPPPFPGSSVSIHVRIQSPVP